MTYYNSIVDKKKRTGRLGKLGEDGIIDLFRQGGSRRSAGVLVGIGDDAALVKPPSGGRLLVTTDLLAEGVHFTPEGTPPDALGYKLAAANVSDIGAMGGLPFCALLSLALPRSREKKYASAFSRGLAKGARDFSFRIVGGDTTASAGGVFANLVLLGTLAGRRPLTRSNARPGDLLFVTGHLGASALGLAALERNCEMTGSLGSVIRKHLRPLPPHRWGAALGRASLASAAVDISDGLALDLHRLCRMSGVGAEVFPEKLPLKPSTRRAASLLGQNATETALRSGEEYELLFTVPPRKTAALWKKARGMKISITVIGTITESGKVMRVGEDGSRQILPPEGWQHF